MERTELSIRARLEVTCEEAVRPDTFRISISCYADFRRACW
jgi:hypothetical protein